MAVAASFVQRQRAMPRQGRITSHAWPIPFIERVWLYQLLELLVQTRDARWGWRHHPPPPKLSLTSPKILQKSEITEAGKNFGVPGGMVRGRSIEVGSPVKIKSEASNGMDEAAGSGADAMEVEVEENKGPASGTGEAEEASAVRGKRAAEPSEGGKEAKRGINYGLRTSAVHALMTECSAVACGNYTSDPLSSCTAECSQDHFSATITQASAPRSGSHPDPPATPAPAPLAVRYRLLHSHLRLPRKAHVCNVF